MVKEIVSSTPTKRRGPYGLKKVIGELSSTLGLEQNVKKSKYESLKHQLEGLQEGISWIKSWYSDEETFKKFIRFMYSNTHRDIMAHYGKSFEKYQQCINKINPVLTSVYPSSNKIDKNTKQGFLESEKHALGKSIMETGDAYVFSDPFIKILLSFGGEDIDVIYDQLGISSDQQKANLEKILPLLRKIKEGVELGKYDISTIKSINRVLESKDSIINTSIHEADHQFCINERMYEYERFNEKITKPFFRSYSEYCLYRSEQKRNIVSEDLFDYYVNGLEIHSRIQELRYDLGLDPTSTFTQEHYDTAKRDKLNGSEMFQFLSSNGGVEDFISLMNNIF